MLGIILRDGRVVWSRSELLEFGQVYAVSFAHFTLQRGNKLGLKLRVVVPAVEDHASVGFVLLVPLLTDVDLVLVLGNDSVAQLGRKSVSVDVVVEGMPWIVGDFVFEPT